MKSQNSIYPYLSGPVKKIQVTSTANQPNKNLQSNSFTIRNNQRFTPTSIGNQGFFPKQNLKLYSKIQPKESKQSTLFDFIDFSNSFLMTRYNLQSIRFCKKPN